MQFVGTKGITLFVLMVSGACVAGLGSGFLVGRQFPARSFQKYGDTRYLLDPIAGKLCDPFKNPKEVPFATYGGKQIPTPPPGFVIEGTQDANGTVKPIESDYPPACGK
jgi:hypothetical protein